MVSAGSSDPATLLPAVRRVVRAFGNDLPLLQSTTLGQQFRDSYRENRFTPV
jgi:hypothetical protein